MEASSRFVGSKTPITALSQRTVICGNSRGNGFIEFEISNSTISTVFCQPLIIVTEDAGDALPLGHKDELKVYFGTVGSTCLTLFQTTTAGMDWQEARQRPPVGPGRNAEGEEARPGQSNEVDNNRVAQIMVKRKLNHIR